MITHSNTRSRLDTFFLLLGFSNLEREKTIILVVQFIDRILGRTFAPNDGLRVLFRKKAHHLISNLGQIPVEIIRTWLNRLGGCTDRPHESDSVSPNRRDSIVIPGGVFWPVQNDDTLDILRRWRDSNEIKARAKPGSSRIVAGARQEPCARYKD